MSRYLTLIAAVIIILSPSQLLAASSATLTQVVETLEQGYKTLNDLQADFAQRTSIGSMKRDEKGNGEIFLKRGTNGKAMFRFNYVKPKQQIVSNGQTVWYYLPENRQVIQAEASKLFSGGNAIALSYLTGLGRLSQDFIVEFAADARDRKGNYQLDLVPKKPTQAISRLQLTVAVEAVEKFIADGVPGSPFPLLMSVLTDTMGNRTTIEYSKLKVNRGVGAERFSFKIPAGVEIIKQ